MNYRIWSQILLELALAVSSNRNLDYLLNSAAKTLMRKLDCIYVNVLQNEGTNVHNRYTIPRWTRNHADYDEIINFFTKKNKEECVGPWLYVHGGCHYYGYLLPEFGFIILGRGFPFPEPLINELVPIVNALAQNCMGCLELQKRKEMQVVLERIMKFQRLLTNLATDFINVSLLNIDEAIQFALNSAGKFTEVDRAYLFSYDFNKALMHNTHEWCGESILPAIELLRDVPCEPFIEDWVNVHKQGRMLHIPDVEALPHHSSLYEILSEQNIRTLITIPLMYEEQCLGFIGFDAVTQKKQWRDEEIILLKVMAELFTNALLRRQHEEELVEARCIAEKASSAKSEFLSNMSHEIRTPINAIVGFTELAMKTSLNQKQSNYLKKIKISSQTLLELIGDILDVSKLEADKLVLESSPFELEEVLQKVANQVSGRSQEKGLELLISVDENVPLILTGDSLRLGQVLTNLIGNAVKFTEEGEIITRVQLLKDYGTSVLLQFSVQDTGIGLTEEQIKNLFIPFTQAETFTTRKYGGSGLGLAISRKLVSLMNGDIWVESEAGKGSIFFFKAKFKITSKERFGDCKNAFEMCGIKVLLVGNSENSMNIYGCMLERMSFAVTMCTSGEEALALLRETSEKISYDLVVMDYKMTGMNGIEATRHIREFFSSSNEPAIIMLSNYNCPEVLEKAEQLGLAATLFKPVTSSMLLNTIMETYGKDAFRQIGTKLEENNEIDYFPQLRSTRVLLVEDNEINQEVAQDILIEAGMIVTIVGNGKEAVDMVKANTYDIILMDVQMPIMDGYDATREIRKNPTFAELPIIALTANVLLSDQGKCFEAGMNAYISKPIDTIQLFQTMEHLIENKKENVTLSEDKPSSKNETLEENNNIILQIAGIDEQTALRRLGGNYKLFRKLQLKFYNNHKRSIDKIRQALDQGDHKTAEMFIHTIKGEAGNLGAEELYLAASNLEAQLRASKQDDLELLINRLEQVLDSIVVIEDNGEVDHLSESGVINSSALFPDMNELAKLLEDHDMDAVECLEGIITKIKSTSLANKLIDVRKILEQYDFNGAVHQLYEIINSLRKEEESRNDSK